MRTGRDFFTQLRNEIQKLVKSKVPTGSATMGITVSTSSSGDVNALLSSIDNISITVNAILESIGKTGIHIIEGGNVYANSPADGWVNVEPTRAICVSTGLVYSLTLPAKLNVIGNTSITKPGTAYILLDRSGNAYVSNSDISTSVMLAKIIIPKETTSIIRDDSENENDAYIIVKKNQFFKDDFKIDDESVMELRTIMDKLLADNLIGEIRLSSGLTITNTDGSLSLDSTSMLLKYQNGNTGMKLDKEGIRFYDSQGRLIAYFTINDAKVGALRVTPNGIESTNFSSGNSGFQIKANGDAEFYNGTFRGTITAISGYIGGNTIDSDSIESANWPTTGFKLNSSGLIQERDSTGNELRIRPSGLFSYNKNFTLTHLPGTCDFIDYLKLYNGTSTSEYLIDGACYIWGNVSGVVIKKFEYATDPTFPDTVIAEYKLNSETGVYYETKTFEFSEMAGALVKPEGLTDGQYVQNLTASQITVGKLRDFSGESYFDLANGKLNIKSNDTNPNRKIAVGNTDSDQCMYYDLSTGRLTVRHNDYVRNLLDFSSFEEAVDDLPDSGGYIFVPQGTHSVTSTVIISKPNVHIFGNGPSSIIEGNIYDDEIIEALNTENFTIRDLTIRNTSTYPRCIRFNMSENCIASRLFLRCPNVDIGSLYYIFNIDGCTNVTSFECYVDSAGVISANVYNDIGTKLYIDKNNIVSGAIAIEYSNSKIINNYIYVPDVYGWNCGISARGDSILVHGNTLICENNNVDYGINSDSGDRVIITNNHVYQFETGIQVSSRYGIIGNNSIEKSGAGITLLSGSCNFTVIGNVIHLCPTGITNLGSNNEIAHNINVNS